MADPIVVWFTGVSSSGTTWLARRVRERLLAREIPTILLDEEEMRSTLTPDVGDVGRDAFYAALGRLAGAHAWQGFVVLVAATTNLGRHHDDARAAAPRFLEVDLSGVLSGIPDRDVAEGANQRGPAVLGEAAPHEAPSAPDVIALGVADDDAVARVVQVVAPAPSPRTRKVYVSLALAPSAEIVWAQRDVCERFGLLPRRELHVTLGYVGEATLERLQSLQRVLLERARWRVPVSVRLLGTGGALRAADGFPVELSQAALRGPEIWKVVWWAVDRAPELEDMRVCVAEAMSAAGVAAPPGRWWPHVTVGSNAPIGHDGRWDVHDVDKRPFLSDVPAPERIDVGKLHVTDASIHPASLFVLSVPGESAGGQPSKAG